MNNVHALTVRNLSINFERWGQSVTAINDLTLDIPMGQWMMLTGHNGSGKSTLMKAIAKQLDIASGEIAVSSNEQNGGSGKFSCDSFFVNQDPLSATADALTLLENLIVADPDPRGKVDGQVNRHAYYEGLLDYFDLTPRSHQLLKYFSGGERQQIALSIAKMRNPYLLLLDEPFSALDPSKTKKCIELVTEIHKRGTTILQITHDMDIAYDYGDRTIGLDRGRLDFDVAGKRRHQEMKGI